MGITNVGIGEDGLKILNEFMEKLNKNSKRSISRFNVLDYVVHKLSDSDIPKLQAKHYRPSDKLEVLVEEHNQSNPGRVLTKEEMLEALLENFQNKQKQTRKVE